jgi:hypothetical protein
MLRQLRFYQRRMGMYIIKQELSQGWVSQNLTEKEEQ